MWWYSDNPHFGECGGLERTDFEQYELQEDMVILKGLILEIFTIAWYGGLERANVNSFLLEDGCEEASHQWHW